MNKRTFTIVKSSITSKQDALIDILVAEELECNVSFSISERFKIWLTKYVKDSELYASRSEFLRTAIRTQLEKDLEFLKFFKKKVKQIAEKKDPVKEYMHENGYNHIKRLEF